MPFILLAFSNKQDNYLEYLKQETSELRRILLGLQDRLEFQIISNATTEDLFVNMSSLHDKVTVFHYGGHADSLYLELENRTQGIEQFVQLLKGMANLQIVFLNGCSTQGMVSKILEGLGRDVAVIATTTKIDDQRAFHFSKAFYSAFTQENQTLEGAFEMAKSVLAAADIDNTTFRESVVRKTGDTPASPMPWGVYGNVDFTKKLDLYSTADPKVTFEDFKISVKEKIADGDFDEAFDLLKGKFGLSNNDVVGFSGRWNRHKKDLQKVNILPGSDTDRLVKAQLSNHITEWMDGLDEEDLYS